METVYTEEYKGFTINIIQDEDASNPFEDWDCEPPIAVYYDRGIHEYATKYGSPNTPPTLTRKQILVNFRDILSKLGCGNAFELRSLMNQWQLEAPIDEAINELLSERLDELSDSERLEMLRDIWTMAGVPCLLATSRGYSQGDYAEVLAVATPEFQEACGNEAGYWDDPQKLQPSIDLYGHWAWGDMYGYVVEGDELDSCWGFYGDYDDDYSALSQARDAIDCRLKYQQKQRIEQIKTWIRNKVPFQYRQFS